MKTCTVCSVEKDYDDFYYDASKDVTTSMCKPCYRKYVAFSRRAKQKGVMFNVDVFRKRKLYLTDKKPKEVFI